MPVPTTNLVVRVSPEEKVSLARRASAAGLDVSAFVRRALELERDAPDLGARIDEHERRIRSLEQIAGLE